MVAVSNEHSKRVCAGERSHVQRMPSKRSTDYSLHMGVDVLWGKAYL
jgi:hypothetical protein